MKIELLEKNSIDILAELIVGIISTDFDDEDCLDYAEAYVAKLHEEHKIKEPSLHSPGEIFGKIKEMRKGKK